MYQMIGVIAGGVIRAISAGAIQSSRNRQAKESVKVQQREFAATKLLQSLVCLQQGLEVLFDYSTTLGTENHGKREWTSLMQDVIAASGSLQLNQIPKICLSLRKMIPQLVTLQRKVDPENPLFIKANEAFRDSALLATSVFQLEDAGLLHGLYLSLAVKLNATLLQHFHKPELLAMVVTSYINQLMLLTPIWNGLSKKARKGANEPLVISCIGCVFALALDVHRLVRQEEQEEFHNSLTTTRHWNLLSLAKRTIVDQISITLPGVTLESVSGIVVNSKGEVILADAGKRTVNAMTEEGQYLWQCEIPTEPECSVNNDIPVAIAMDQHDQVFVAYFRQSTNKYTILKYDAKGRLLQPFDRQDCFADLDKGMKPCGMAVNSDGLIFLGDYGNGCIHVLEEHGAALSLKSTISQRDMFQQFSFCICSLWQLLVAANGKLLVFKWKRVSKNLLLKDAILGTFKGKYLAVANDMQRNSVIVVTGPPIKTRPRGTVAKPMLWYLEKSSQTMEFRLEFSFEGIDDEDKHVTMATGPSGLWFVDKKNHQVHCLRMAYHLS